MAAMEPSTATTGPEDQATEQDQAPAERREHPFVSDAKVRAVAVFNGQGNDFFPELCELAGSPHAGVSGLLSKACALLKTEADILEYGGWYADRFGLDVQAWIEAATKPEDGTDSVSEGAAPNATAATTPVPPEAYLKAAPVSYPLIFLVQVLTYLESLEQLGGSHAAVLSSGWLAATTGHSQGILAAVVLSMSTTPEELEHNALTMLRVAMSLGMRAQECGKFELRADKEASPMLSVRGLSREALEKALGGAQRQLSALLKMQPQFASDPERIKLKTAMHVALRNGADDFVVSGNFKALSALREAVAKMSAEPGASQTRVPFSKRKPSTTTNFLQVTAPFHCSISEPVVERVLGDLVRMGVHLDRAALKVPVFSTSDGSDLRAEASATAPSLAEQLVRLQLVELNDFLATLGAVRPAAGLTHVVSFGPGRSLGKMCHQVLVGSGVQVVDSTQPLAQAAAAQARQADAEETKPSGKTVSQHLLRLEQILIDRDMVTFGRDWALEFKPRVVQRASDGELIVDTRYTRVLGKPPVMMSGMTPTTSYLGIDLVAACNNAGFQGELAAGGLAIREHFVAKLEELVQKSEPGVGISINMLYLNAHQWGFQFPLVVELAKAGYPIESITIGAGVPTPGKAEEIFASLQEAGVKMIGFKPGSLGAIRDVLELARLHPDMHVMLQWTSGRGGGHHSFEDFHEPLLAAYAEIRERDNVVLVVGSGFGDADGCFEYLDGTWSTRAPFNRAAQMPVDGVLFGSRCMVAKEAATSPAVKQLIVDAPGVEDEAGWDASYDRDAGGVITVQSELGEPIHKIHTRGMRLWNKYDRKYFALPRGAAREEAILADKDEIIAELNADFQKVYFGQLASGAPADLQDMTYGEVLQRMVDIMYVRGGGDPAGRLAPNRWVDRTYQSRTFKMMLRTERRFLARGQTELFAKDLRALDERPEEHLRAFLARYPLASETLLADDDVEFFIDLCKDLRNGKPVNFIPVIDGDLAFWLKKDSLWCSEQLDAVPGRDPGRVCILHGPVAAKYSTKVDEPIADILGNIHRGLIRALAEREEAQGGPRSINILAPRQLQTADWSAVAMQTERVVLGKKWVPNPIYQLCQRPECVVRPAADGNAVELFDQAERLEAVFRLVAPDEIELQVFDQEVGAELCHRFAFRPALAAMPLHQSDALNAEVKTMYRKVWDCAEPVSLRDVFSDTVTIAEEDIVAFNKAVLSGQGPTVGVALDDGSIDIATMAGWRPLVRALFADDLEGNLLRLVHLSHGYRLVPQQAERRTVRAGERLDSESRVTSVQILPGTGKKIRVEGMLWRYTDQKAGRYAWLELQSEFLIRGDFSDYESTFSRGAFEATVLCDTADKAAVVRSKPWFTFEDRVEQGDKLIFRLSTVQESGASADGVRDVAVRGVVLRERAEVDDESDSDGFVDLRRGGKAGLVQIGTVAFGSAPGEVLPRNPVVAFLEREREPKNVGTVFESGGYQLLPEPICVEAPTESLSYALASRDLNPIHRNRAMATLAQLPRGQTIVHGMWTAAMARGLLERAENAGNAEPARIAAYEVEFVGMVFPGDQLCVSMQHVGVTCGRKIVNVLVNKLATRELVMKGRAEIEQPKTAYLFTGQGSAAVGMGMDRYTERESVRAVWDTADRHLKSIYGFSILQIVRDNPKSLTVHFGGPQGKRIRDNYRKIHVEDPATGRNVPLIPEIRGNTKSFTFKAPQGLLFATQFSQPALVLVQKAAFEELLEGGFVPDDAVFAGHSLGEYAALASFADVLSIEALVETVFLRGMVMQNAVERDRSGRSDYAMVAANPSRVGPRFTPDNLETVVAKVEDRLGALLQIVNFNVRGSQYVVAGELVALDALSEALKLLSVAAKAGEAADFDAAVAQAAAAAEANRAACRNAGVLYALRRGVATIPLPGIDVPFHSKKLLSGVPAFRQLLEPRLDVHNIAKVTGRLVGKYIPNVVAKPFALDRAYIEEVHALTGSPVLERLLQGDHLEATSVPMLARTLVIELLAHQFAMPVRWIETQDVMFHSRVLRVIEMGPAATLATMAKRTLQSRIYGDKDEYDPAVLWWKQDADTVFYDLEDNGPDFATFADAAAPEDAAPEDAAEPELESEAAPVAAVATPAPAPVAAPAGGAPAAPDAPVSAQHALRVLLSAKFGKPLAEIPETTTIKALSNGKSAIQNEVVGDLGGEFGGAPEGGAEMPLSELASKFGEYTALGKVTRKAITKLLGEKLPGGFSASAAKQHLTGACGLGPGRTDSVLLHALSMPPAKRLAGPTEAKQWLEACRDAYAQDAGVDLRAPAAAGAGQSMQQMMMMMPGTGGGAAPQPVPDAAVSAQHALRVLLSAKFGKPLAEIPETTTIKALSNGKSAIQNEVVGDLGGEFGGAPEGGAEMPLSELASKFGEYTALGKVTRKAITKLLGEKLPGGFSASAAKQYLADERLLGPGRTDSVLLHALSMPPAKRLPDAQAAKAWLDSVADGYAAVAGVSIPRASMGGGGAGPGMMMPMLGGSGGDSMSSETVAKLLRLIETQVDAFGEFLGRSPQELHRAVRQEQTLRVKAETYAARLQAELGEPFCEIIQPQHDARKVRIYDSSWNWVIQDALDMHCHVLAAVARANGQVSDDAYAPPTNEHYRAMAEWITTPKVEGSSPPQAWFRNYLCNRATPELLSAVRHFSRNMHAMGQHEYAQVITLLAEQVEAWVDRVPVHMALILSQAPRVRIDESTGAIEYYEEPRSEAPDTVRYVEEMSRGLYYFRGSKRAVADPSQSVQLASDVALFAEDPAEDGIVPERDEPGVGGRKPRSESELMEKLSVRPLDLPRGPRLDAMRKTIDRTGAEQEAAEQEAAAAETKLEAAAAAAAAAGDVPAPEDYASIHVSRKVPFIHIKSPSAVDKTVRIINEQLSSVYLSALHDIAVNGVSFAGQVALVTGAGRGSIAEELVKAMLEGGATVVVTLRTSRTEEQMTAEYTRFRRIYEEYGAKGSRLVLEPSNCASAQDMRSLVAHVYETLELDIDFVVPFAAAPERGKDISGIDSQSEAAHRMMLTNVVRLLGEIKAAKEVRNIDTRPAMVLLPCSPNHGEFGYDGLYAESKLGCEALVNKWGSEGWGNYLSLSAAVIGWTRSALMTQNNVVAPGIERLGCRTFSPAETTFNLVGLLHPRMVTLAAEQPLWADLTGNWVAVPDMTAASQQIRARLQQNARLAKSKLASLRAEKEAAPTAAQPALEANAGKPLANPRRMGPDFPTLPESRPSALAPQLQGMVDLRKVVVVVGFGEVGPWGNARTRWEMEAFGEFSLEGAIELAWMVGLIKPHNGPVAGKPRSRYIGWVDAESGQPVADHEVKKRYEKTLLAHCGIRLIEPELFEGYNAAQKSMLHSVAIDRDLPAIEVASYEEAMQYQAEIGEALVDVYLAPGSEDQWMMRVRKGAVISIPKAMKFDRKVAGQIPTGWDAKRLGVPPEIAETVDPVTLYALVSTMEALVSSGVTDPYELYEYVHVSEVGNTSGGGMGGMRSLKRMFFERKVDKDIPSDTLAESFINTMPAWVNMLLFSSSGPIKTPVGACATAAESLDIGMETILSGKARVVLAGGYDDFGETGSYEFAQMGATNNSELDFAKGRAVHEASRPMTDSRAGFLEAHGAGMQLLMDAELAVEMGCPIYAVLALTNTATDKQGRSVPAPGRGILTTARESAGALPSPMLDMGFRADNLRQELEAVDAWRSAQLAALTSQAEELGAAEGAAHADQFLASRQAVITEMAKRKRAAALETWGQGFYKNDPTIAPLRGALSVWGLTVDDIAVSSFHGTSTKLNDKNESAVVNKQMEHLGRTEGNILCVITQKYMTGHPKGGACAWMLNGLIQSMLSSTVPGNRNLDNVSPELRANGYLFYPNRSIRVPEVKAAFLKSFGFGQAGAEALVVHPDLLLAALSDAQFDQYKAKRTSRERRAFRYLQGVFSGKHTLVQVKNAPPYTPDQEEAVYLNPRARAAFDPAARTWTFAASAAAKLPAHLQAAAAKLPPAAPAPALQAGSAQHQLRVPAQTRLQVTMEENASGFAATASEKGLGVDVEPVSTFADPSARMDFIERNFTKAERDYCFQASSPAASFAGRWAAKEAIVKAISNTAPDSRPLWQGAQAPLRDIEVLQSASGAPSVRLHGHAQQVFAALSLRSVKVSISHAGDVAVAQALAE